MSLNCSRRLQSFAARIKDLRLDRRLTQRELARRSGVSQATLSRWEGALCGPHLTDMEDVLRVLKVSSAERGALLRLLRSPSAWGRIQSEEMGTNQKLRHTLGPPPHGGMLLRIIRLREGVSQLAVAAQIGVNACTIRRWECGARWPAEKYLLGYFDCMQVDHQEKEALLRGPLGLWQMANEDPSSGEAVLENFRRATSIDSDAGGVDYAYLAAVAKLWTPAPLDASNCLQFYWLQRRYADFLHRYRREAEASVYDDRAAEINEAYSALRSLLLEKNHV